VLHWRGEVREKAVADQTRYAPVSPYLSVHDGYGALEFYKQAFAADVRESFEWQGRLGHATIYVNGGEIMLSHESDEAITGVRSPKSLGGTSSTISLAVGDVDAWFDRAVAAGCRAIRLPKDEFYGRMAKVRDPYGHVWGFAGPARGDV
jgi:PhnB protein